MVSPLAEGGGGCSLLHQSRAMELLQAHPCSACQQPSPSSLLLQLQLFIIIIIIIVSSGLSHITPPLPSSSFSTPTLHPPPPPPPASFPIGCRAALWGELCDFLYNSWSPQPGTRRQNIPPSTNPDTKANPRTYQSAVLPGAAGHLQLPMRWDGAVRETQLRSSQPWW